MFATIRANATRPERACFEYFQDGHAVLLSLEHYLDRLGRSLGALDRVLDFACGFGRVTRHLTHALGGDRVWASDIDRKAVDFVAREFGAKMFYSHTDPDEVAIPGSFDVIFVGSLFTHLPHQSFGTWLKKLYRALDPNGTLVFSTNGYNTLPETPKDESGFTFLRQSETERLDLDEYGTTFITPGVTREIAAVVGVVDLHHFPKDLWHIQDLWLARPQMTPQWDGCCGTPTIYGEITKAHFPRPDHAWIGGYVKVVPDAPDVVDVRILIDEADAAGATLGEPFRVEEEHRTEAHWNYTSWYAEGPANQLAAGRHVLSVVGITEDGRRRCIDAMTLEKD